MNYVQTQNIRKNKHPRTKKANTVAPTAQRVYDLDAKTQRCQRDSERQTKISPCNDASNGFLRASFLPKLLKKETIQACKESEKMQTDFYNSLTALAEHYNIQPMLTKEFEYPYNITLAIWDIEEKLKKCVFNWQEIRLLQGSEKTYLMSEEKYTTGTTLYYIPTEPLYEMTRDPKRKKNAQLLISVCSYLYHVASIPYFRQEDTYLYWMYEMHKDWVEQDDETEQNELYKREIDKAELIGDCIEKKIFNPINLKIFENRLKYFKQSDTFDKDCYNTAFKAFTLFIQYPDENLFRFAPNHNEPQSDQNEEETITMEKYISFISNTKGWLYESIADSINNEFNEYGAMDEPTIIKCFDGTVLTHYNLDFESQLFALLDDLCALLYHYKTTRI